MPELPEIETIRRGLQPLVKGRRIKSIDVFEPKTMQVKQSLITEVILEHKISSVERRAKVLMWHLDNGYSLLFHLKMTGQIIAVSAKNPLFAGGHPTASMNLGANLPDRSTRLAFTLSDNVKVYFNDQRKFGWVKALKTKSVEDEPLLKRAGPEPLSVDFTDAYLGLALAKRKAPIKAVLLDQSTVAGLGNIYVDESLFLAGIHPLTSAYLIKGNRVKRLREAIVQVLRESLDKGGTSFTNYVNALGVKGDYLHQARVFRREGLPCRVCKTPIKKIRVAGRGTHYCPVCQPAPRRRRQ